MSAPLGVPRQITLHWTAGGHDTTYDDYHFCIRGSGEVVQTLSCQTKGAHTWGRNSGNIGVSLCAMLDGKHPVTDMQREACARLVAELCGIYGLACGGSIMLPTMQVDGPRIVATGRTRPFGVVADHAAFARADGYFPDRWDIGAEYGPILKRANWYRAEIVAGRKPNTMAGRIK